jgi:hypothetical protein
LTFSNLEALPNGVGNMLCDRLGKGFGEHFGD